MTRGRPVLPKFDDAEEDLGNMLKHRLPGPHSWTCTWNWSRAGSGICTPKKQHSLDRLSVSLSLQHSAQRHAEAQSFLGFLELLCSNFPALFPILSLSFCVLSFPNHEMSRIWLCDHFLCPAHTSK